MGVTNSATLENGCNQIKHDYSELCGYSHVNLAALKGDNMEEREIVRITPWDLMTVGEMGVPTPGIDRIVDGDAHVVLYVKVRK